MSSKLRFKQRKFVLNCYWKNENVLEVQRSYRREFYSGPTTRLTISRIRDNLEDHRIVHGVHKNRFGSSPILTSLAKQETAIEIFFSRNKMNMKLNGIG